jgi:hypothetical protein
MATSTNPALGPRYGLGRTGGAGPSNTGPNTFNTPAASGGFGAAAKSQQRLEAERLERERKLREERERMEQAGQNSLAELSEEQREEITEAVSPYSSLLRGKCERNKLTDCRCLVQPVRPRQRPIHRLPRTQSRHARTGLRFAQARNPIHLANPRRANRTPSTTTKPLVASARCRTKRLPSATALAATLSDFPDAHGTADIEPRSNRGDHKSVRAV